jgi:catechol 2,3-dioxygenase-like lactoylglutathione lyase family enzyme
MVDVGLTHVALPVKDVDVSAAFYAKYAKMKVVHRRTSPEDGHAVAWLSDNTRPFVIVLIETENVLPLLTPWAHLGVGCESREEVDRLCDEARAENILIDGPTDSDYPVGYWCFLRDPDGHTLELSYGQEVGLIVEKSNDN